MRRVFLDTNILLDFALEREHAEEAEKILALGLAGATGCDVIVTNNGKDFAEFCDLPYMTATEFLERCDELSFLHTFILPVPHARPQGRFALRRTIRQGFLFLPVPFLPQIDSPYAWAAPSDRHHR